MVEALALSQSEERTRDGAVCDRPVRHVLHVLPGFGVGDIQMRLARIINALGPRFRHTILSLSGDTSCRNCLDNALHVGIDSDAPSGHVLARLHAEAHRIRHAAPDLLATYSWGAIEWAMANTWLAGARHYHFEDGFGLDEAMGLRRRRNIMRRVALARAAAVVVPSHTLEQIAINRWHFPASRVLYVPNGVDIESFRSPVDGAPIFARRADELIIGTVSPLRPEKNLPRLLGAFTRLDDLSIRLAIAGEGSERPMLEMLAQGLGIADRVMFLDAGREPQRVLALFDIFALSSDTEQMPMTVLEAMATGLPVAAVDVGDIKHMVAPANRAFVVPPGEAPLANALASLAADPGRRHVLGRLNRGHVGAKYPFARMADAYLRLFEDRI